MKTCTGCRSEKSEGDFYVDKTGYRDARCKECVRAVSRRYYATKLRHKQDVGEITLTCQHCGALFTYAKTTGPRRKYCGERCKALAGEIKRVAREAAQVRQCRVCGTSENVTCVGKPICKSCRKVNRNNTEANRRRRLNMYGLTGDAFDEMLAAQRGKCAICAIADPGPRGWHIDHDHGCCAGIGSCGECVRGLLCHCCNLLLGNAKDDIEILDRAKKYLAVNSRRVNTLKVVK